MAPPLRARTAFLAIPLVLAGCGSMQIRTDYDRGVEFAHYASFAWLEEPLQPVGETPAEPRPDRIDPFEWNSLLDKRVRSAVDRVLLSQGFQKATGGDPDFWIRYHTILRDRTRVTSFPGGVWSQAGPYAWGWADVYVDSFQEGTLILDVIDPALNQLVWRGWAVSAVGDPARQHENVQLAVERILERFPPSRSD